jgi:hypothetical protein
MSPDRLLKIVGVDRWDQDKIMVSFSDETTSVYTAEQILELTPILTVPLVEETD